MPEISRATRTLTYKTLVCIAIGLAGFALNFWPINVDLEGGHRASFMIGLVFPMIVALAWGWKYGLLSATVGMACQSGWFLWGIEPHTLISLPPLTLWIVWHGWCGQKQRRTGSRWWSPYLAEIPFRVLYSVLLYSIFKWMWASDPASDSFVPLRVVKFIIAKDVLNAYVVLLLADAVMSFGVVKKVLMLGKSPGQRGQSYIVATSVLLGFHFWIVDSLLDHFIFRMGEKSFLDVLALDVPPHELYVRSFFLFGCLIGGLLVSKFVLRQREDEEALNVSENLLASIIDQTPFSTLVTDARGDCVHQNPACRELFGVGSSKSAMDNYNLFSDPMIKEQGLLHDIEQVFKRGHTARFAIDYDTSRVPTIDADEAARPVLNVTIFPIKDPSGRVVNAVVQHEDITERIRAQEGLEQANQRLKALATTDELTGLCNRRHFLERLDEECKRAKRYGTDLALLMLDVDLFKTINDTYGHAFGDLVLIEAAAVLAHEARNSDVVARYAGDEFMVLMPNATAANALTAAERIRERMTSRNISDGKRAVRGSFSMGISSTDTGTDCSPGSLVSLADEALYAAKQAGRDCVMTWDQVPGDQRAEALLKKQAIEEFQERLDEISHQARQTFVESIQSLTQALEARDHYTKSHSENVTRYAVGIARTMGLGPEEIHVIRRAAMVHDVGKIGLPDSILNKPGRLTPDERRIMEQHVLIGVRILAQLRFLDREVSIVRHHHERCAGSGYPDGISGQMIPLGAQVLAVADAFDAITSDRCYQKARSVAEAVTILAQESGKQFAPDVASALIEWVSDTSRTTGRKGDTTVTDILATERAITEAF